MYFKLKTTQKINLLNHGNFKGEKGNFLMHYQPSQQRRLCLIYCVRLRLAVLRTQQNDLRSMNLNILNMSNTCTRMYAVIRNETCLHN
jgi:hypothetical protein